MEVKKYQEIVSLTAVYPKEIGMAYCSLGLTGEAGEVAEKVKKLYRDSDYLKTGQFPEGFKDSLVKEIGDVIWYCTALSSEIGVSLSDVMDKNYEKLIKRRETNTLHGNGDNREEAK